MSADRDRLGLEPVQCLPFGPAAAAPAPRRARPLPLPPGRCPRGRRPPASGRRPEAVEGGEHQLRLGLADDLGLAAARHLDRRQDRAGAGPEAVGLGVGGVAGGGEEVGAAARRRARRSGGRRRRGPRCRRPPRPRRARPGRCRSAPAGRRRSRGGAARRVPTTKAVRPERVSASRCWSAPPTVTTSPSDARMPILHSRAT